MTDEKSGSIGWFATTNVPVTFITKSSEPLVAHVGDGSAGGTSDAVGFELPWLHKSGIVPVNNVEKVGDGDCGDRVGFQLDSVITEPAQEIRELAAAAA